MNISETIKNIQAEIPEAIKEYSYEIKDDELIIINGKSGQKIIVDELKEKIKELYNFENIETEDLTYLTNARSISLLEKAYECLDSIKAGLDNNMPIDMVEIDIKDMWNILGEITGETYQDELIDQLFSQFCLGK